MTGFLLRLAGPMQSWGEHSVFAHRDTARYPTRSGLIGMFAAALGRKRHDSIQDLVDLTFTVRVDRPGVQMVDFHTVGGDYPRELTVPTAEGKRRPKEQATIVSRRYYLADAVFAVAVSGPDDMIDTVVAALKVPVWAPYLGRRACPPDEPLLLCDPVADPASMLERLPLARRQPEGDTVTVDFVYERPPAEITVPPHGRLELADVPESFAPDRRLYRTRTLYVVPRSLPVKLCAGYEYDRNDNEKKYDSGEQGERFRDKYLIRLTEYLQESAR